MFSTSALRYLAPVSVTRYGGVVGAADMQASPGTGSEDDLAEVMSTTLTPMMMLDSAPVGNDASQEFPWAGGARACDRRVVTSCRPGISGRNHQGTASPKQSRQKIYYTSYHSLLKGTTMSRTQSLRIFVFVLVLAVGGGSFVGCKKDSSPTGPSGGAGSVVNVSGKVISLNGQPVSGVPVFVSGKPSVNSDANGAFTIASVTTPYDITVVNGTAKQAYIYRAISRSDPTLVFIGVSTGTVNTATISGNIYPTSAYPQPATRTTQLAFVSPEVVASVVPNGLVTPATYNKALSWYGATSTTGTIYALQWDVDASSLPTTYQRYGSHSGVMVVNGGTFANVNDTMSTTPGTLTLSGSVTAATGYNIAAKVVFAQFGGKTAFTLATEANANSSFSYKTPDITGLTIMLESAASKAGAGFTYVYKSGISPSSSGVTVSIPAAPELSLPVDAATGVKAGSPFSWNAFAGGVQILYFNGPAGQPDIYVMTMAASDSLPNLTSAGLPIPASTSYQWSVIGFAPFASMDAATGTGGFLPLGFGSSLVQGSVSFGESNSRTFTTAP